MERTPIRLSSTSFAILGLIEWRGPSTAYDLKRAVEMTVSNFWPVPHTTFYDEPARLAAAGYLTEEQEEGGRRRRLYTITGAGREALAAWVADPSAAPHQVRDEALLKVFFGADPEAVMEAQIAFHREKLTELERYLELVRDAGGPPGIERSLVFGTAYERALLNLLRKV